MGIAPLHKTVLTPAAEYHKRASLTISYISKQRYDLIGQALELCLYQLPTTAKN